MPLQSYSLLYGGLPRILLEITYKFAKTNTFIIPEIIHNPSLMLSPYKFFLGILFDNDAFCAPTIKSRDDLRRLWLEDSRQQLLLPLKAKKANYYIFCKVVAIRGVVSSIKSLGRLLVFRTFIYIATGTVVGQYLIRVYSNIFEPLSPASYRYGYIGIDKRSRT
ncbi:hypothetical protein N7467_005430 [Penicillium canescens]|nr:hypothetical protein N7467_005430 [Penicillium canescens]